MTIADAPATGEAGEVVGSTATSVGLGKEGFTGVP
jgi:hypothetical protein